MHDVVSMLGQDQAPSSRIKWLTAAASDSCQKAFARTSIRTKSFLLFADACSDHSLDCKPTVLLPHSVVHYTSVHLAQVHRHTDYWDRLYFHYKVSSPPPWHTLWKTLSSRHLLSSCASHRTSRCCNGAGRKRCWSCGCSLDSCFLFFLPGLSSWDWLRLSRCWSCHHWLRLVRSDR